MDFLESEAADGMETRLWHQPVPYRLVAKIQKTVALGPHKVGEFYVDGSAWPEKGET